LHCSGTESISIIAKVIPESRKYANNGSKYGCERVLCLIGTMTRRNQGKISKLRMLAIPLIGTCTDICDKESEMNKRLLKTAVGLSLVIVGLLAIVSCVPGEYKNAEAASLAIIPADLIARAGG
jgi:hypothetical protein